MLRSFGNLATGRSLCNISVLTGLGEKNRPGKDRFKISELFTDERCIKAILDSLATTEVGWTAGPPVADEEPGSEASEWEKREREEYLSQVEVRVLGDGAEA